MFGVAGWPGRESRRQQENYVQIEPERTGLCAQMATADRLDTMQASSDHRRRCQSRAIADTLFHSMAR